MIKLDFSDAMASSGDLLENAEIIIRNKLKSDPDDENVLWQLGHILRQKGDIAGSLECFKQLTMLKPGHKITDYITAVFEGNAIDKFSLEGAYPAPFLIINDFLGESELSAIWTHIKENEPVFGKAKIDGEKIRMDYRKSGILTEENLGEIKTWFPEKVYHTFLQYWNRLLAQPVQLESKEIELNMHADGGFYKVHKDSGDEEVENRIITFVYYFFNLPRKFTGGDLLLFDTNPQKSEYLDKFTKIEPISNSIIFFPSNFFHQVTPVHCKYNDLESCRFTLNGWLY